MLAASILFAIDILCRLCFSPGYSTSPFFVLDVVSALAVLCQVREYPGLAPLIDARLHLEISFAKSIECRALAPLIEACAYRGMPPARSVRFMCSQLSVQMILNLSTDSSFWMQEEEATSPSH
jgi:hypothetical protein